jgi:DNA-binding GntR family transcriptional regulator
MHTKSSTILNADSRRSGGQQKLVTEVAHRIRDMIVSGKLSPGAPIIESQLARFLGLSRTPVRAALERLEEAGHVRALPTGKYSRMVVAPMTMADLEELYWIIGNLEGLAAAAAAKLEAGERERIARELEKINAELLACAQASPPDLRRASDVHVLFHRVHVEAAAGPRLLAEINSIQPQVERYERLYTQVLISEMPKSVAEHTGIIAAIRAGDPELAERRVAANWRNGAERSKRGMAMLGERGRW